MPNVVQIVVPVLFAIFGLGILGWLAALASEILRDSPSLKARMSKIMAVVFSPAPAKKDIDKTALPLRFSLERILPLLLWLLILLPMIILPIVLILFPILGIPWSQLMPASP